MLLPTLLLLPGLVLPTGPVLPAQAPAPEPTVLCTPADPGLEELSGLGVRGGELLATGDGGTSLRVAVLDGSCAGTAELATDDDPRDVEDLAVATDGTVWLADTGDNSYQRESVALFGLRTGEDGTSTASLHRLTYPDGAHDAEALLLGPSGVPLVVTKEVSGTAGIYSPQVAVDDLASPGPTPLQQVGTVQILPTTTPGGPVGGIGSVLVTGGAVSADGTVVALRTYTDAYLFAAPDGDLLAALGREPVRVPLPDEPQGEAIAFTADGALLSGSEQAGGDLPPIRSVAGATTLAAQGGTESTEEPAPADEPAGAEPSEVPVWQAAALAVLVAGLLVWLASLVGRRRRRG